MVDQIQQSHEGFSDGNFRAIGYNFDKNIEQNIEILIERAKMLLEHILLGTQASSTNPILNIYYNSSSTHDDTKPIVELMLRASSLLSNLLVKAPNFKNKEEYIKLNKEYSDSMIKYIDSPEILKDILLNLKDLALETAKKLGMTDQSIKTERWEHFLLSGSELKLSGTSQNSSKNYTS